MTSLTRCQFDATVTAIARTQEPSGRIPWVPGGKTDPWNLVEAAMALDAGGQHDAAAEAYRWLRERQLPHGGWYSYYVGDDVVDRTLDTNVSAYVCTGTWHHHLATRDSAFLRAQWPVVEQVVIVSVIAVLPNVYDDAPGVNVQPVAVPAFVKSPEAIPDTDSLNVSV